jgi:DNA-binding transcriptional ArsR family regulator
LIPVSADSKMASRNSTDESLAAFQRELDEIDRELAGWSAALGHPVRARIIDELRASAPRTRRELAAVIETSPSTLRRSLRRLVDDRLVAEVDGGGYKLRRLGLGA